MPNEKAMATRARHYVYIQTLTRVPDGEGGFTTTWASGANMIPMEIVPIKATQRFQNRTVNVEATHRLACRGNITLNEKTNRILFGERQFEILTFEDLEERGIEQVLTCKELR